MAWTVMLLLLGALAGGVVGWIAKRDEARRYIASRERYWRNRVTDLEAMLEHTASSMAAAPATTVVQHFHMSAPVPNWPAARVVEAEVLRALPGEVA